MTADPASDARDTLPAQRRSQRPGPGRRRGAEGRQGSSFLQRQAHWPRRCGRPGQGPPGAVRMVPLWRLQGPGSAPRPHPVPPRPPAVGLVARSAWVGAAGVQVPEQAWAASLRPPLQAWLLSLVPGGQAPRPPLRSAQVSVTFVGGRVSRELLLAGVTVTRGEGGPRESCECPRALAVFVSVPCGRTSLDRRGLDV